MIHHTVFMNTLRTARYFLSIQINPQTLIRIGRDSHRFQKTNNTLQIVFKQGLRCRFYKSKEEFYKLKYCSTVVYMVPRA